MGIVKFDIGIIANTNIYDDIGVIISILIEEENYFEDRNNREMEMRQN